MTTGRQKSTGLAVGLTSMACSLVLLVGVVASPLIFATTGLRVDGGASTISPTRLGTAGSAGASPSTAPADQKQGQQAGSPAPTQADKTISAGSLTTKLNAIPKKQAGTSVGLVLDPATGRPLYDAGSGTMMVPASNMKLLTSLAALNTLGASHRLETKVVSPAANRVVLVGGGDPLLRSTADLAGAATTADLAAKTAAALKKSGVASVTVGFDESLFQGPAWHPTWTESYRTEVTPVSALMIGGGYLLENGEPAPDKGRTQQPALLAATIFAWQLSSHGIKVTGSPTPIKASGATIAAVQSMPLSEIVSYLMLHSDNNAAEAMLRLTAIKKGLPGDFSHGASAVKADLVALKILRPGTVIVDGSGLSKTNRVSPAMLGAAWLTIMKTPVLKELITSVPVAGVSGTLRSRFFTAEAAPGRGFVHAKTGTLNAIHSLSGWTTTRDGQTVIVAFIVNDAANDWEARVWLDQVTAAVSSCGC